MTTTNFPTPLAGRLQRPSWRDPRLIVGVLVVCASVTLGSVVMERADRRSPVFAARTALVPGQRLSESDLVPVDVQLGGQAASYLSAAGGLGADRFVLREVRPGELVPSAAIGSRTSVGVQPLTVAVDAGTAASLVAGSQVDVYVNPPTSPSGQPDPSVQGSGRAAGYAGPRLALHAVSVAGVPEQRDTLGVGSGLRPVQVMAPTPEIRGLIASIDEGARVTLVPVPGALLESAR